MKTAIISVDFDYFVREKPEWDWGHREVQWFLEDAWNIRYSTNGFDIKKETDPVIYADFMPASLISKLALKKLFVNSQTDFANAESHLAILRFLNIIGFECDLFINIDAHHDLFYEGEKGEMTCGNWWWKVLQENPGAKHIWIYPKWLEDIYDDNSTYMESLPKQVEQMLFDDLNLNENYTIKGLFFCRSGCWVPPHLDGLFNQMCCKLLSSLHMPERKYQVNEKLKAEVQKLRGSCGFK